LDAEIIEKIKIGKEVKYRIIDADKIMTFLIIHSYELSEENVSIWISWTELISPKNIDSMLDFAYNIVPHPYHV
jgi:hypothetical protein